MLKQIKNKQHIKKKIRRQGKFLDAIIFSPPDVKELLQAVNIITYYLECVRDVATSKLDREENIIRAISCTDKFKQLVTPQQNNGSGLQPINEFVMEADSINDIIKKYKHSSMDLDLDESSTLYSKLFRLQYILSLLRQDLK